MHEVEHLAAQVGVKTACEALGLPRSSHYAARQPRPPHGRRLAVPPRALSPEEKAVVHQTLDGPRFADQAPREVYATLLDEGTYLCSVASMYRILRENQEVRERRNQLRHPAYAKPRLLATGPNQVWTWDTLAPARKCSILLRICQEMPSPDMSRTQDRSANALVAAGMGLEQLAGGEERATLHSVTIPAGVARADGLEIDLVHSRCQDGA